MSIAIDIDVEAFAKIEEDWDWEYLSSNPNITLDAMLHAPNIDGTNLINPDTDWNWDWDLMQMYE